MARNIGADGTAVYRAVITFTNRKGHQWTEHEGPYAKAGAARARVTFWQNYMASSGGTATGHVEQAHTVWAPIGEQPTPDRATTAAAYRQAADDIDAEYTGPHADQAARYAAEFLRRRADQIHPATEEQQ